MAQINWNDPVYGFGKRSGGLLGGQAGGGGGLLGGGSGGNQSLQDFWNSDAVLPTAAALIAGPTFRQGLASAFATAGQGVEQGRKRRVLADVLKSTKIGADLSPETQAYMRENPEFANNLIAYNLTPHRQFTQIGQSIFGQPTYGWVDASQGTVTPVGQSGGLDGSGGAGAAGAAPVPGTSKLYEALPKAQQAQVDQIIAGKIPYPSGFQLRTPYWNAITAAAEERAQAQGTPLDATLYPTRLKTREAFTTGQPAQMITAGNAAIGHLGSLDKAIDKLGNWNGVPLVNYAYNATKNAALNASGAATDLQTFNAIKSKYSQEITKFYRSSGGSDSDIQEAMGQLDAARSPAELHATVKAQVTLLKSKISALQEQWHTGVGANEPDFPLISKEAQKVLDRIAPEGGDPLDQARAAIAAGAPRDAVIKRLQDNGIDPGGL